MKKWLTRKLNKENAVAISQRYDLPMLIAMLLDIRGITDEDSIIDFLSNETLTASPFEIKDMDKAVERIQAAIEDGERICIYGDFDADGVTSTALLYSYLSDIGADAMYYIPSRETEGYGMHREAIARLYERGVKLIITVDNGVAAVDEVAYAKTLGIDTVITDHHAIPETLPDAVAVVDLHRPDCNSSFKELSGVGVAFKLVQAIEGEYADVDGLLENYSDLAAIGTVGDIVTLRGENRVLVKNGLRHINNGDRLGIAALAEDAGLSGKEISAGNLSFTLVPRINAGGRLGLSKKSVKMLLTDDEEYAADIAAELSSDNTERQQIERDILSEIDGMIRQNPSLVNNPIIVVYGEGWHKGVIGIVASRIKEVYAKPAVVISMEGDVCRASGRSVSGFSLIDAVFSCSDILTQCGGHPMAVGFGIKRHQIENFIERINRYTLTHPVPQPVLELDCKLNPAQLSVELARGLSLLEPFGAGNPTPLFGLYNMTLRDIREIGGGKHLRLTLSRGESTVYALRFSTTLAEFPYIVGDVVDLAVTLDINTYNNYENLSIFIRDMRFADREEDEMLRSKELFERFCRGEIISAEEASALLPDRAEFAVVYRFLRSNGGYRYSFDSLLCRLGSDIGYGKLRVILECMNELQLIEIDEGMYDFEVKMCEVGAKVDLDTSVIITKLREVSLDE
ncbi:single-stranded-DNA-specific exonuclease RecJ [Ruminococcus difficilis]|uniref:Single-stranded-DNA-specific exonuclease RecJ n=1 Tax=Ruminococcus difficilis TaxID=2763069 RepID=A0A934WRC6_9FIRM|nr:single-stranded-DNA-specific exonuclease RecJ [Ruminococcus difficilis]MBK6088102.1 single-stranded-DNA-specific exonuclease RecJ [Ruminococcus difficilis]